MKKTLILTLINTLVHTSIIAQKNFVSGYIINQTGDTMRGKIDDKQWSKNPTKILFMANGSQAKMYNIIAELRSFGIENKSIYLKKTTSLDITPYDYNSLLLTSERIVISDTTIVLKQLIKGKISLYAFKDANGKDHFFIEKLNEPIEELIKHDFFDEIKGTKVIVKQNIYNDQLADLCQDCSLLNQKKFNYNYSEASLKPVILEYNAFFGDKQAKETTMKEILGSNLYFQIGVGQYSYLSEYAPYGSPSFSNSGNIVTSLGVGWLLELPSNRRKVAVKLDLMYHIFNEVQQSSFVFSNKKNNYLGISIAPQYSFYKNKDSEKDFYVLAGGVFETPLNNTEYVNLIRNYAMYGYKVGVGFKIKKINMNLSYVKTNSGEQKTYINNTINRIALTLGYALF
ncbi:MAG: hypothetical protein V4585_07275 [Bacteroidota bacterium]